MSDLYVVRVHLSGRLVRAFLSSVQTHRLGPAVHGSVYACEAIRFSKVDAVAASLRALDLPGVTGAEVVPADEAVSL